MKEEDEMNLPTEKVDAVIAGAGGAGMDAALTLAEAGARLVVFEKMSYAGGSTNYAEGITL